MKNIVSLALLLAAVLAGAQAPPATGQPELTAQQKAELDRILGERAKQADQSIRDAENGGIAVRLGDIGQFRGARSNVITGIGLVVGLAGTGDTKSTPWTATLISNAMRRWGTFVDDTAVRSKNIATVMVTAEVPPFLAPGSKMDITVSSNGDAKSLEGGVLLPTFLAGLSKPEDTVAVAFGPVSIGGFNASSGGSSVRKNHPTVALVTDGATLEASVPTQFVFDNGTMYFDLDDPDFTNAERAASAIQLAVPGASARAIDGATVEITLPGGMPATALASQVSGTTMMANTPGTVVVNERTGTIIVGGNVRLGPALIAHGSLSVRVTTDYLVSQPAPFSDGQTTVVAIPNVEASESPAQTQLIAPNATLSDLARVLQELKVSARDVIAILQGLQRQGALKARVVLQ
ncbi:MAG: flagellar basal body P-ring protein FlgI [Fimbriimonadaceae bacterium]